MRNVSFTFRRNYRFRIFFEDRSHGLGKTLCNQMLAEHYWMLYYG
jgi:hypothetical protein